MAGNELEARQSLTFGPASVSVAVPVFNAVAFVHKAVASALAQPEVAQVVLAEDGSTDNSLSVCEELVRQDARVKLVRHPGGANLGAGATRNLALAQCTMPWVAFLDADDRYLPDRFAAEHRVLAAHPDAEGVYGAIGVTMHDAEGERRFAEIFSSDLTTVHEVVPPERLLAGLIGNIPRFGYFHLDALTVSRAAVERMPEWFKPELRLHQDTEFLIRLAHHARLYPGTLDRPVALRGVHRGNRITANKDPVGTRLALWGRLEEWGSRTTIAEPERQTIQAVRMHYEILAVKGFVARLRLLGRFRGRWWLLDRPSLRAAYFNALLGKDSLASRLAQKIVWRLFNRRFLIFPRTAG